jgi:ABC-type sugar transport system ATPase subunit
VLELRAIERRYDGELVLAGVDLEVRRGELVALIGPSGAGKSTLLRIVAGLDRADGGTIRFDGRDLSRLLPAERRVGMAFDDGALYEHLTVRQNIHAGLDRFGLHGRAATSAAAEAAQLVGANDLLGRLPTSLSAGERRRVALARAIARRPDILLLDEPLTHLDVRARLDLREDLRAIHDATKTATIVVTHDHADAIALADRLAYLDQGRIRHQGTAASFAYPDHLAVASGCSWHPLNVVVERATGTWLAFPPESARVARADGRGQVNAGAAGDGISRAGVVRFVSLSSQARTEGDPLGVVVTIEVFDERPNVSESASLGRIRVPQQPGHTLTVGDRVRIEVPLSSIQRFDPDGRALRNRPAS